MRSVSTLEATTRRKPTLVVVRQLCHARSTESRRWCRPRGAARPAQLDEHKTGARHPRPAPPPPHLPQILESWRTKRIIEPQKVDDAITLLDERRAAAIASAASATSPESSAGALSRDDIKRRMEEDRERHKRLRERRWVQPVGQEMPAAMPPLASFMPLTDEGAGVDELALDIEFDNEWETTSDWNEDDDEAVADENELCFLDPVEGGDARFEQAMDLS